MILKAGRICKLLVLVIFYSFTAHADEYPSKPITIVAPYSAGGASDLASRNLSAAAAKVLEQPVIVVNRTGAGGVIGSTYVSKARPDGYTLLLARVGSQSVSPAMNTQIPYKYDDFTMLGVIELNPVICATGIDKPYKTMQDVIDAVRENPGKLSYSSAGVGSFLHITVPFVLDAMGIENAKSAMKQIPYKGDGQAATAAVGGHVDFICTNSGGISGYIAGGKLRPLMLTTEDGRSVAPDTPTARELGFPEIEPLVGWSGLFAPPNMDDETVKTLREMLQQLKNDVSWNDNTKKLGSVAYILDGDATENFVETQYIAFKHLIEKLDMQIK